MQLAQRRAGIDAQLVGERSAQSGVVGQRIGRAALPGQCDHQVRVEVLTPRPACQHVGKRAPHPYGAVRRTIRAQLDSAPPFERAESSFVPGLGRRPQVDAVNPSQRVAPPQREGAFDRRRVATREQFVGLVGVQPVTVELGAVADTLDRLDEPRQPVAHLGNDLVDLLARRARWLAVPEGRHERVERHGIAARQQEPGQQSTRSRAADGELSPAVVDCQRAQDAQLHTTDGNRGSPIPTLPLCVGELDTTRRASRRRRPAATHITVPIPPHRTAPGDVRCATGRTAAGETSHRSRARRVLEGARVRRR